MCARLFSVLETLYSEHLRGVIMYGSEILHIKMLRDWELAEQPRPQLLLILKLTRVDSPLQPLSPQPRTSSNADVKAQLDN